SSRVSRLIRYSRLRALAARARTKFGNPSERQKAARCSPPSRLRAASAVRFGERGGMPRLGIKKRLHRAKTLGQGSNPAWGQSTRKARHRSKLDAGARSTPACKAETLPTVGTEADTWSSKKRWSSNF